jgi:PmbA protein
MERYELTQDLARDILKQAEAKGASAGEVVMAEGDSFFVTVRMGDVEKISQARAKRLGLRLFFGKSSATASTSDISKASIEKLIDDTAAMARATARDEFSGLPDPAQLARDVPELDLLDEAAHSTTVDEKIALARAAESRALEFDPRIANSEGGEFSNDFHRVVYANSEGFCGEYQGSIFGLSVAAVARLDGSMQRDYWYSSQRKFARLEGAGLIGEKAARRALRRLGARKVKTCEVPVVFDPEVAAGLLRSLAGALSGYSLYKGASFLVGKIDARIASSQVALIDDGTIPTALGSKPFDGEGVATSKKVIIENGMLRSYLLDSYSGRKLGFPSTGNAARGAGEPPSVAPTNFYLTPGASAPEEIIKSVDEGFYVTDLIGFGVNLVTGDYSRGASGLWIQGGELAYPVEEVTIAGNLKEMLLGVEMVGNDLELRNRISAPTIKISRMTVAGE